MKTKTKEVSVMKKVILEVVTMNYQTLADFVMHCKKCYVKQEDNKLSTLKMDYPYNTDFFCYDEKVKVCHSPDGSTVFASKHALESAYAGPISLLSDQFPDGESRTMLCPKSAMCELAPLTIIFCFLSAFYPVVVGKTHPKYYDIQDELLVSGDKYAQGIMALTPDELADVYEEIYDWLKEYKCSDFEDEEMLANFMSARLKAIGLTDED
jgi:hypothetical protein